jgi:RNA 2',3'-cyclic 3'-phosphodiesterase
MANESAFAHEANRSNAMPRLFTGLELPADAVHQMSLVRGGVHGARWMEPKDYHITLRFVGDVDLGVAHAVAETLDKIRREPVEVRFEGLSWFGGDKPRAIVARVRPDPALVELQAEQERRMRRIGLPPETRKYTPHVTLARLRGVRTHAVADYLASRGALPVEGFTAERFVLYSSRESVGGGPYVVEAAYPLG